MGKNERFIKNWRPISLLNMITNFVREFLQKYLRKFFLILCHLNKQRIAKIDLLVKAADL